jgi:hypothetical protein
MTLYRQLEVLQINRYLSLTLFSNKIKIVSP